MSDNEGNKVLFEVLEDNKKVKVSTKNNKLEEIASELVMKPITPLCNALKKEVDKIDNRPNKINISFGLKVKAEGKIVIASSSVESNILVSIEW